MGLPGPTVIGKSGRRLPWLTLLPLRQAALRALALGVAKRDLDLLHHKRRRLHTRQTTPRGELTGRATHTQRAANRTGATLRIVRAGLWSTNFLIALTSAKAARRAIALEGLNHIRLRRREREQKDRQDQDGRRCFHADNPYTK